MAKIPGVIQQGNPFAGGLGGTATQTFGGGVAGGVAAPVAASAPNPYLRSGGGMGGSAAPAVAPPPPIATARKGTGNKGRGNGGARKTTPYASPVAVGGGAGGTGTGSGAGGKKKKKDKGGSPAAMGGKGEFAAEQKPHEYFTGLMRQSGIGAGGVNAADKFNQWLGETGFQSTYDKFNDSQFFKDGEKGYKEFLEGEYGVPKQLFGKQAKGKKGKKKNDKPQPGVKNPGQLLPFANEMRDLYFAQGGGANTNPATQVGYGRYSAFG